MKYCIAVAEILIKTVVVDKENLEKAIEYVRDAFQRQQLSLMQMIWCQPINGRVS